jgi:hypothetical protein
LGLSIKKVSIDFGEEKDKNMSIDTRLNYDDIVWLIAAADAWEEKESHEFYMAKEILSIPDFEEAHPAFEFIQALKRKYRGKEQQLADKKDAVAELSANMKARLYFIKKELGIDGLLNVAEGTTTTNGSSESKREPIYKPATQAPPDNLDSVVTGDGAPKKPNPLEAELAEAIRKEDYTRAAELRDAIKDGKAGDS